MSAAAFTHWAAGPDEPAADQAALQAVLGQPALGVLWRRFSDGEYAVQLDASVHQASLLVVQRVADAEALCRLLLLVQKLKASGARRVEVFCPYLFYGRQQGKRGCQATPFSLIIQLLKMAGADALHILDPHDETMLADCGISVSSVSPAALFAEDVRDRWHVLDDVVIVSPDAGSRQRAGRVAKLLKRPLVVLQKKRVGSAVQVCLKDGAVSGRRCVLADDIVDTGATLQAAVHLLKSEGAQEVGACITHGVLSLGTGPLDDLSLAFWTMISTFPVAERTGLCVRSFAPLIKTLFCAGAAKVG
jgi:ribose-phosphate pyrophosphokinase